MWNGAKRLGYKDVHTGRMAINSRPRDGRAACQQLGFRFQGCKTGAKWSTLYAEIPKVGVTGNLDLRPECQALTITHNDQGMVDGVVYAAADGGQHRQAAVAPIGRAVEPVGQRRASGLAQHGHRPDLQSGSLTSE